MVYELYPKIYLQCKVGYTHCKGLYDLFFILQLSIIQYTILIPYNANRSRWKIFTVFADLPPITKVFQQIFGWKTAGHSLLTVYHSLLAVYHLLMTVQQREYQEWMKRTVPLSSILFCSLQSVVCKEFPSYPVEDPLNIVVSLKLCSK